MPALTVFGNPPRKRARRNPPESVTRNGRRWEVVGEYKGVPVWLTGGTIYGAFMRSPTGGNAFPQAATMAGVRRLIGAALKRGYAATDPSNHAPKTPLSPMRKNPPTRGVSLSKRVLELRYQHAEDGKLYKHAFKPGVCAELLPDGSVRLYGAKGQRLWGDF